MAAKKSPYIEGLAGRIIRTTLPPALEGGGDGTDDPRRAPGGPPAEGVERFIRYLLLELPGLGLHPTAVGPDQLARVRADRFDEAPEYVERVANMMVRGAALLPRVPFSPGDLQARLHRCKSLDELIIVLQDLLELLTQSAHLEWSDLLKMCDFLLRDVEAQIERPTLDPDLRRQLSAIAAAPLETWRGWVRERQQRQADNQRLRDEGRAESDDRLRAALLRAEAAEARLRALGHPVAPPPASELTLPSPGAARRGRRREEE